MKIVMHKANGLQIGQRREDGYIDATALCRASNKRWNNYWRMQGTQAFLEALSEDLGLSVIVNNPVARNRATALIQVFQGGHSQQGTWVHPEVAIDLGQWVSVRFRILVNRWVREWMMAQGHPSQYRVAVSPDLRVRLDELERLIVSARSQARTLHTGAHQPVDDILLKSLHTLSHNQLSVIAAALDRIQALQQAAIEDSSSGIKIAAHPAEPVDPIAEESLLAAEVETRETSKPIEPFPVSSREPSVRWTVDLSESLHRKLSLRAARSGRSKADIVRMLLEEALQDVDD
jgi:KilA-N domain